MAPGLGDLGEFGRIWENWEIWEIWEIWEVEVMGRRLTIAEWQLGKRERTHLDKTGQGSVLGFRAGRGTA